MPRVKYTTEDSAVIHFIATRRGGDSLSRLAQEIFDGDADAHVMYSIEDGKRLDAEYENYCLNYDDAYGI